MTAVLAARALQKSYRGKVALAGVDLQIEPGELLGLLGPNGAGKSTLTKIACGLVRPSAGGVEILGKPGDPPRRGRRSAIWPSSSASPAGALPMSCCSCTSG